MSHRQKIRDLIEDNPGITFRGLFLQSNLEPSLLWESLKSLRGQKIIEAVKISNKKGYGYKLQLKYLESSGGHQNAAA